MTIAKLQEVARRLADYPGENLSVIVLFADEGEAMRCQADIRARGLQTRRQAFPPLGPAVAYAVWIGPPAPEGMITEGG
jgi:hypothetical protein